MTDGVLSVDDLVTGRAAAELGPGVIPSSALLIVETVSEQGTGLRFVSSDGVQTWQVLGMLRSVTARIEHDDLMAWFPDEED